MTKIEEIARKLVADDSGPEGSALFDIHWNEFGACYIETVGKVLQAIREPTKGMWEAGTDAIEEKRDYSRDTDGSYECTRPSDQAIPCWQAMIDHIIQEGKK